MNDTAKIKALDVLYATLPRLDCQKKCSECCGPVAMTRLEAKRINQVAEIRTFPLPATHEDRNFGMYRCVVVQEDLTCPLLKDGLCSVYAIRPAICRLWGLVPKMKCPHGCEPERWITKEEEFAFIEAVTKLGF
jgi:hypothetical protein